MSSVIAASVGIAGVNTRPLHAATLGIAGNWGSTLRPHLEQITACAPLVNGTRLGDRAAKACWAHACYLLDYTYVTCPDRASRSLRYRSGFASLCAPETRPLPVYLDSAAYREAARTAPAWSSYTRYCQAIELIRPDGAMARDVLGNQDASRAGYERLCRDGYGDVVIPVWQARPAWDPSRDAASNGRLASQDPTLHAYADRAPVVAIGGLVHGPCPRAARHLYLAELVRAFPDTHFWALGQASAMVVNGLGQLGLLDHVSTDGSWWIHHARTEQFAVVQDGLLKSLRLTHTGASSFFTLLELMAANLRSLLSAYAGLWTFPAPARVPTDLRDPDIRFELRRRLMPVQLELFARVAVA
jgi:hypothetical protein